MAVLSSLQEVLIRGEFISGADSGCLDNVSLGAISGIATLDFISYGALKIFPNPAKEYATLQFVSRQSGYFTIDLFTESGDKTGCHKEVYCSSGIQEVTVPLNNFAPGSYFFKVNSSRQTLSGKLLVR